MADEMKDNVIAIAANVEGETLKDIKTFRRDHGGKSEAIAQEVEKSVTMRRNGKLVNHAEKSSPERVKDVNFADLHDKY